ncbi:MAG: GPW/gp25 family protein [Jatrophihabitantaceae bacterium]
MTAAFPYQLTAAGATAIAIGDDHVRQLLEQLLFTDPGERVNRPDFGCGLLSLVFVPNSDQLASGLTVVITAAVQQWLGSLIELAGVEVEALDSELSIAISYRVRNSDQQSTASFQVQVVA